MSAEPGSIILTFPTTRVLLAAERALGEEGWAIEVIPVPVGIASDCGFCVRRRARSIDDGFLSRAEGLGCEGIWKEITLADTDIGRGEKRYERR